jgi:hypothetical protein
MKLKKIFVLGGGWGIKVQLADKNTLLQLPEERLVNNEATAFSFIITQAT